MDASRDRVHLAVSFLVLGPTFPGVDPAYRGVDRMTPVVDESLGPEHVATVTLLATHGPADRPEGWDLASAKHLRDVFLGTTEQGPFEIVELTGTESVPSDAVDLLGYDVAAEGGTTSLIVGLLLYELQEWDVPPRAAMESDIRELRSRHLGHLNKHRLFATQVEAQSFLEDAVAYGTWEGPGADWVVAGIWSVPGP